MTAIETRKAQLEARKAELESRLNEIEHTLDAPAPHDDEDRATEREEDEVLESLGASGLKEIQMIDAALGRIAEGTYGECAKCGNDIGEARLDLLPFTPFCRDCAA
jgi:RNA polymerase-binding transcription factor DksA